MARTTADRGGIQQLYGEAHLDPPHPDAPRRAVGSTSFPEQESRTGPVVSNGADPQDTDINSEILSQFAYLLCRFCHLLEYTFGGSNYTITPPSLRKLYSPAPGSTQLGSASY